jgi:hypothetical protein
MGNLPAWGEQGWLVAITGATFLGRASGDDGSDEDGSDEDGSDEDGSDEGLPQ